MISALDGRGGLASSVLERLIVAPTCAPRIRSTFHIDITERGTVIAHLVPAQESPLAEMISSGKLHPATISGPAPRLSGPIKTEQEAGQVLRELRDNERY
ncbi:Antitoxin VapB35 [Mycobacterium persicum]|uniref:Antitoxin VapB35 n=1 Tax=Mycobacterium persicum TaxID=1487726 RepID=A0AB38UNT0_9MYCO|nr:Antitoxin VapB35 [Mycobacterium persicum]VAZ82086.1 Antitoxin VapB35 [Mycobacterium persicum]VAZ88366.1 Antitoxin VapB35 [Mycobacterium persicum]